MEDHEQMKNARVSGVDYQVRLSDEPSDHEWDAFVSSLPHGHHVQTSLWSRVKSVLGYRTRRVIVTENGHIVAGGQLLIRQLLPFVSIAYMPKGPIYAARDPSLVSMIIDELRRVAQTEHFLVLTLQPASNDSEFKACLADHGFRPSWLELAPTATILHDLTQDTQDILRQMKRQTRQKINRSEREGITTREGTETDLQTFYQLYLSTSQRQGFTPYPVEYFARMWQVFSQQGVISLVMAEYQGTPVSALLLVGFGSTVCPKILGWSGEHAARRPNDAVFWAAIQWAKSHGYHCFDMEGIDREGAELKLSGQPLPDALRRTPDHFKLGYGGTVTLLPESYYLVPSPLWRWPYRQIFGLEGRGQAVQRNFERYRRRFG
jgi:peptidoglycan pentaglycine glycine transferase (the first glycine)